MQQHSELLSGTMTASNQKHFEHFTLPRLIWCVCVCVCKLLCSHKDSFVSEGTYAWCTAATPELCSIHDSTALHRRSPWRQTNQAQAYETSRHTQSSEEKKKNSYGPGSAPAPYHKLSVSVYLRNPTETAAQNIHFAFGSFTTRDMLFQLGHTLDDE